MGFSDDTETMKAGESGDDLQQAVRKQQGKRLSPFVVMLALCSTDAEATSRLRGRGCSLIVQVSFRSLR